MKPALLTLVVLVSSVFAFAQSSGSGSELRNSGIDYVRLCGPSDQGQQSQYASVCGIWLAGVVDGLQAYNSNAKSIPLFDASKLTLGQLSKQLLKYIADHPDKVQLPTAALVLGTLIENYQPQEPAPHK
jgi:hypothetical protein